MSDKRFVDDRSARRDLTGLGAGAAAGAAIGLAVGYAMPGVDAAAGAAVAGLLGAAAGGLLGRWLARRVTVEEWDPNVLGRPHVGAHTPDDDLRRA